MDKSQMPMEALLQILQDSLEKKIDLLGAIEEKSKEQEAIIKKESFTFQEMDENMEGKSKLIEQLSVLDNGFETLYEKIRKELLENKDQYRVQIEEIQNLIVEVTARGASIEAIEARNKAAIEAYFSREKKELQKRKNVSSVARSYYQTAKQMNTIAPQFLDTKK
jgi:protoporphyrinogen oxidase